MSIKPILFNAEMVRAILNGRKTCTRRKIPIDIVDFCDIDHDGELLSYQNSYGDFINPEKLCRYQPGDILYIRETWHKYTKRIGEGAACHLAEFYGYKASIANSEDANEPWKPSIHMPKEAARIWLKVTDVRVERLQEITKDGCVAEGIYPSHCRECSAAFGCNPCPDEGYDEIDEFVKLWNSIIKKADIDRYGWDANPYVWVLEFERCEKPRKE